MAGHVTLQLTVTGNRTSDVAVRVAVDEVQVDPACPFTWLPASALDNAGITRERQMAFRRPDGKVVPRSVGFAHLYAADRSTSEMIVFAEEGDRIVIGARTLTGLNLRIDPTTQRLVDAGPVSAAAAA